MGVTFAPVHAGVKSLQGVSDDVVQPMPMLIAEKDVLAMIASQRHMVETAWDMNS